MIEARTTGELASGEDQRVNAWTLDWARHHAPTAVTAVLGRLPAAPPGDGRVRTFIRDLDATPRARERARSQRPADGPRNGHLTAVASRDPRSGRRIRRMLAAGAVSAQTGRETSDRPGRSAMAKAQPHLPDMLPVLSPGKHRNPRKGACFMELASYLAGERWSDHPACTHSLLASVARLVNDHTSDEGRPLLAELIPSVIGLTGDDLHIDALITLRCATIALPVAAADRQRVLAVSVLVCESVLARLDGRRGDNLSPDSERVLGAVPDAAQWADRFTSNLVLGLQPSAGRPRRRLSAARSRVLHRRADPGS